MPTYELTLKLNPSRDFRKLVVLIHGVAIAALLSSSCPVEIMIVLACALGMQGYVLVRQGQPSLRYTHLIFQAGRWFLQKRTGVVQEYARVEVRFDVGLFMRVQWMGDSATHSILLFHDQITAEQRRMIYLLQLTQFKSESAENT